MKRRDGIFSLCGILGTVSVLWAFGLLAPGVVFVEKVIPNATFAALEKAYGKTDGHAYVITKEAVIPCFPIGTDGNEPLPCEAAVAGSMYFHNSGGGADETWPPLVDMREKYERLKAAAAYCGICGPSGRQAPGPIE